MLVYAILVTVLCFKGISARSRQRSNVENCAIDGHVYQHNEQIVEGNFWYRCIHGIKTPSGCIDQGQKIDFDGLFIVKRHQWECYQDADGYGTRHVGCTTKDEGTRVVEVGERFDENGFRRECTGSGIEIVGCLIDDDEYILMYPVGSTYIGQTINIYDWLRVEVDEMCKKSINGVSRSTVACNLYKDQEVIKRLSGGCSEAIQLEGKETILHCGGASHSIGIRPRQEHETVGCVA